MFDDPWKRGAADWVKVAGIWCGEYEWREFQAYFDPHSKRYYWLLDSGCSCTHFGQDKSVEDWNFGGRNDLLRAIASEATTRDWWDNRFSKDQLVEATKKVYRFNENAI